MAIPLHTEASAFQAFIKGDERGLSFYFARYYPLLCYYAISITKEEGISEEFVSEAFLRLWRNRQKVEAEGKIKNLLYVIVRNLCFSYLREQKIARRHKSQLYYLAEKTEGSKLEAWIEAESFNQIHGLLKALPKRCRQIFQAYYFNEKSLKEIAKELGISVNTVKSQKHYATARLKKLAKKAVNS